MSKDFSEEEKKLELENRRWNNRRKMAYSALGTGIVICLTVISIMAFADIERIKAISESGAVFLGVLGFLGSIVVAYVGTAAYSDVRLWG